MLQRLGQVAMGGRLAAAAGAVQRGLGAAKAAFSAMPQPIEDDQPGELFGGPCFCSHTGCALGEHLGGRGVQPTTVRLGYNWAGTPRARTCDTLLWVLETNLSIHWELPAECQPGVTRAAQMGHI